MVDSASPITFINIMTWKDLEKPQLQSTDRVLGAFAGQPIKPLGYFLTPILQDDTSKTATLPIYVSHRDVWNQWNGVLEWNGGMEHWNGIAKWFFQ